MALKKEIEHRFLLPSPEPKLCASVGRRIVQGYLDTPPAHSLRVRVIDGVLATLTRKDGAGIERDEDEEEVAVSTAHFLLRSCRDVLRKVRHDVAHGSETWTVDFCEPPLESVVIAELELPTRDTAFVRPPWLENAIEVTDTLTSRMLARLATELHELDVPCPPLSMLAARTSRILLTGGPCSGKSKLLDIIGREFSDALHMVPEAASIVITHVGAKPPLTDPLATRRYNVHLSRVQRGFEELAEIQAKVERKRGLILDRGVVDNAAYLPRGLDDLEHILGTTAEHEYRRYDLVICLETPSREIYEAHCANNPARYETYEQARALSDRIRDVWSGHPNLRVLAGGLSWKGKSSAARNAVRSFLDSHS